MLLAKKEKIRDDKYLKSLRFQPCSAAKLLGCYGDVVPAHNRVHTDGGTSLKPSDCFVSPLCFGHHAEEHQRGAHGLWHSVYAEDTQQLFETRKKAQMWDYLVYLHNQGRGNDMLDFLRNWGGK